MSKKKRGWKRNEEEKGERERAVDNGEREGRREERTGIKREQIREAHTYSTCMSGRVAVNNR